MKKTLIAVMMVMASGLGDGANAQIPIHPMQGCAIPKLDGDKVPFPLKTANSKFELAENETYLLNGYIVQQEGKPYFKLDFQTQPWLATYNRSQFPYFPVDAEDQSLIKVNDGALVQMAVVVRKSNVTGNGHEWNQNLKFDMITPPVIIQPEPILPGDLKDFGSNPFWW